MKISDVVEKGFKKLMPSPFTIALLLTFVAFLLAWFLTESETQGIERAKELLDFWSTDLWNVNLLAFAVQMMLMLVLGHALALTKPMDRFISKIAKYCTNTANAALVVTLITVITALFNWGLGLIVGAILARKVGEHAARNNIPLNYALIGAAGYSGLMVWHGGLSGSAPLKAAEEGSIASFFKGANDNILSSVPDFVGVEQTLFSPMNITAIILLIVLLPLFMYWVGARSKRVTELPKIDSKKENTEQFEIIKGAERLDYSNIFSLIVGVIIAGYSLYQAIKLFPEMGFNFITPNFINLLLLGFCLLIHKNISSFLKAIDNAIGGASGILIQFPLYFGILGIMKHSGLIDVFSDFFVNISNDTTFSIYTFFSAGLVNVFVPSGGGQWAVQGPIIIQAASELNASISESIMALSYGDQITNMLQPFWALPLLGITGLRAKDILPYTLALMLVGTVIFMSVLLIF